MMSNKGVVSAIGSFAIWGLFPLYWIHLEHVVSYEIVAHRAVWAAVFLIILCIAKRDWQWLKIAFRSPRTMLILTAGAIFAALNWGITIWAFNNGFILDASLGVFISPLMSIVVGILFMGEKLRGYQSFALAICGAAVLFLVFSFGRIPWIALLISTTLTGLGVTKKYNPLTARQGLTLETAILLIPALIYLGLRQADGIGAWGMVDLQTTLMLTGGGLMTAIPLFLYGYGAKRIQFILLGVLEYIEPTVLFFLGVFIFKETFSSTDLIGFVAIWVAFAFYLIETVRCDKCCPIVKTDIVLPEMVAA